MICPHCGKALNTTTFVNPMEHVQQHPTYLTFQVNAAAANSFLCTSVNHQAITLNAAAGANPFPNITFVRF